jgi:hypothetical protein
LVCGFEQMKGVMTLPGAHRAILVHDLRPGSDAPDIDLAGIGRDLGIDLQQSEVNIVARSQRSPSPLQVEDNAVVISAGRARCKINPHSAQ